MDIQMIRELEQYRLQWIEEPLPPHNLEAHARLRAAIATKIGTGEQERNREGYRRLLRSSGVDVLQMDPGRCLGITVTSASLPQIGREGATRWLR